MTSRFLKCRFCDAEAVAVFSLPAGCLVYPNDREQALCAQHIARATPLGTMIRIGGGFEARHCSDQSR